MISKVVVTDTKIKKNILSEKKRHDSITPIDAGMKNIAIFFVKNSATILTSSILIILSVKDKYISTIPITDPGIKPLIKYDQVSPKNRGSKIKKQPLIISI